MGRRCITILTCVVLMGGFGRTAAPAASPRLAPVPNTSISYAPELPYDLFFFNQTWFYRYEEKWYRGRGHRGPWIYLRDELVPDALKEVPRGLEKVKRGGRPNRRAGRFPKR